MRRITLVLTLAALGAAPAAAQLRGMPVWNSPKGGTGVVIAGDLAFPGEDYGKGTAFGAHGTVGLGNLTLGAGLASWKADTTGAENALSYGATAGFRVIGGSLLPVAVNLQSGAALTTESGQPNRTTFLIGAGVSAPLPTPFISIEPYLSLSNRWRWTEGVSGSDSNIGWTLGANLGLGGAFGLHVAYDSEDAAGGTASVVGIGAHATLRLPLGM